MIIKPYNQATDFEVWNDFVANSKQGTFLLNRNFLDHHTERFIDSSLMFYDQKQHLKAILPANIDKQIIYSHQGVSYGGLIYNNKAKVTDVLSCFQALKAYLGHNNIKKLLYKRIPYMYHGCFADEDLYALFINNARLIRRDIGFVVDIHNQNNWNNLRKRSLKKSIKANLTVKVNKDYDAYYDILLKVLSANHNAKPVHSVSEIEWLADKFPENIQLICSYQNEVMLGGVWVFVEKNVIHTQYIAISEEGKKHGAFEAVVDFLLKQYNKKHYLSFGISTEKDGMYLNEGLAWQKESFGATGICYDFYALDF